jgi:hypothetical protein
MPNGYSSAPKVSGSPSWTNCAANAITGLESGRGRISLGLASVPPAALLADVAERFGCLVGGHGLNAT